MPYITHTELRAVAAQLYRINPHAFVQNEPGSGRVEYNIGGTLFIFNEFEDQHRGFYIADQRAAARFVSEAEFIAEFKRLSATLNHIRRYFIIRFIVGKGPRDHRVVVKEQPSAYAADIVIDDTEGVVKAADNLPSDQPALFETEGAAVAHLDARHSVHIGYGHSYPVSDYIFEIVPVYASERNAALNLIKV